MVHARMIRPPVAGATPVKVDESSIKDIPGASVVRENGFLAVVADKEWDAIKASQTLKVEWSDADAAVPRRRRRSTTTSARRRCASARTSKPVGNVDEAFKTAARVIEAEYEWPFQSHACMGPACARGRDQGRPGHGAGPARRSRTSCATASPRTLGMPADKVRRHLGGRPRLLRPQRRRRLRAWTPPCSPRRPASRCALQYTREQGTGWDPKGPASIHQARAAIDASGNVIAYEFLSKGFSRIDVQTNGSKPRGHARRPFPRRRAEARTTTSACRRNPTSSPTSARPGRPSRRCSTAPRRCAARTCAIRSGRRSTSPASPSWTRWRQRSSVDPVEFRLRHVKNPRDIAVIKAAAEKSGWQTRPSPRKDQTGNTVTRPRHRLCAAQRHPLSRSSPRSTSTAAPARSGRASSPSRTTAARSSTRTA